MSEVTESMTEAAPKTVTMPTWVLLILTSVLSGGGGGAVSFVTVQNELTHLKEDVKALEQKTEVMQPTIVRLETTQANNVATLARIEVGIENVRMQIAALQQRQDTENEERAARRR